MQEFRATEGTRLASYRDSERSFQVAAGGRTRRTVLTGGLGFFAAAICASGPWAADEPVRLVALGDSLTAGFGLPATEAFPVKLAAALRAKGHRVEIADAGVSGDTASGGLSRLDWATPEGTEGVILELGANDALRGLPPEVPRQALDAILARLKAREVPVLLCGMRAPRNLGPDYAAAYDAIFPDLAAKYGAIFYPFFLEAVAARADLNQPDGLHPTAAGVDIIVAGILPKAEELIARALQNRTK